MTHRLMFIHLSVSSTWQQAVSSTTKPVDRGTQLASVPNQTTLNEGVYMLAVLFVIGLFTAVPYTYHAPATLQEYTEEDIDCSSDSLSSEDVAGCQGHN